MWWIAVAQAATLSEAWDAARGTNPDRAAAEAADARVGQARAAFLPKVQVAAEADATDEAVQLDRMASLPEPLAALTGEMPPIEVQPQRWWQASATVLVPLVDAQGWARAAAAGRAADAADAQARVADARVRAGVAQAFYGLYVAREGVRIAEGAVEVAKRQQEVARKLVDAGASTERTWLEATQAELAAERDLQGAIAAEIGAGEAFHRLTGLPRETPVELGFAADLPEGLDETRALALSRRPELAAADAQIAAATASRTSAELGWLPTVSARGTALRSGNQGLADDPWFVVGAVQATWTLDGGLRSAQARESAANRNAAEAVAESQRRAIEEEVAVARAERDRARAARAAAEQEVEAADAALAQASQAFEQGAATFVEVDRASLGVRAARLSVVRERAAEELAAARLVVAIGG